MPASPAQLSVIPGRRGLADPQLAAGTCPPHNPQPFGGKNHRGHGQHGPQEAPLLCLQEATEDEGHWPVWGACPHYGNGAHMMMGWAKPHPSQTGRGGGAAKPLLGGWEKLPSSAPSRPNPPSVEPMGGTPGRLKVGTQERLPHIPQGPVGPPRRPPGKPNRRAEPKKAARERPSCSLCLACHPYQPSPHMPAPQQRSQPRGPWLTLEI